jgi:hypothetical protein
MISYLSVKKVFPTHHTLRGYDHNLAGKEKMKLKFKRFVMRESMQYGRKIFEWEILYHRKSQGYETSVRTYPEEQCSISL